MPPFARRLPLAIVLAGLAFTPAARAQGSPISRLAPGAVAQAGGYPIEGAWNGTNLERRSQCANAQNDGSRGTYAAFDVTTDRAAHVMGIHETAITGLVCGYFGDFHESGLARESSGTYSCSDGKKGSYRTRSIIATENALSIRMDIRLEGTETCAIDAVIAAGRFYP